MTDRNSTERTLRRTFLRAAGAAGAAVGIGTVSGQNQEDADIELGGRTTAWVGVSPDEIADERNPTLELVAGEEYTLVWENLDGAGHNFIIEDEEGEEEFVNTDVVSGTGSTQEVEFTAEEGMAEYFCGPHPTSMRGEIELGDEDADEAEDADEDGDEEADDDPEAVQEFAAVVDELYSFTLDADGWHVEEPAELAEEDANPTLELQEGNAYVITWTNELEGGEDGLEADDADDADAEATDGNETDDGDDETDDGDDETDDGATELVLVADDDGDEQEFLRSDAVAPGESGAVTFAAPAELEGYRDAATEAEGAIEVEPEVDEDGADTDEETDDDSVEDLFVDPPDDGEDDDNDTDEN